MNTKTSSPAKSPIKNIHSVLKKGDSQRERAAELKKKYNIKLFLEDSLPVNNVIRRKNRTKKIKKPKIQETDKRLNKIRRQCQGLKSQLLEVERLNLKKHEKSIRLKERIRSIELFIERKDKEHEKHTEITDEMIEELEELIKNSDLKNKEKETQLMSQISHLRSILFRKKCNLTALETTYKEKNLLCRSTLINLKRLKRN